MLHLENKRLAADRHRVAQQSKGIATFLEKSSLETAMALSLTPAPRNDEEQSSEAPNSLDKKHPSSIDRIDSPIRNLTSKPPKISILDKIRTTLDQAAEILRDSLELSVGGVTFLDTATGYTNSSSIDAYWESTEIGSQPKQELERPYIRRSTKSEGAQIHGRPVSRDYREHFNNRTKSCKVLAMSAAADLNPCLEKFDANTLQSFTNSYPKGNVWYIDDEGFFSSIEQINAQGKSPVSVTFGESQFVPGIHTADKTTESALLSSVFEKARQIMFLPLWDAAGGKSQPKYMRA